jgi:hypothetical protein
MPLAPPQLKSPPAPPAKTVERPAPVRAKPALPTSRPGDAAEREADAVATQVMRAAPPQQLRAAAAAPVSRVAEAEQHDPNSPALSAAHQAALGAGEPLPPQLRAELEPRFGQSLDRVRLMTDGSAAQAAASIGARAFTLGTRIGFAPGEFQPTTPGGQWLLAHEIAHVLQQQDGTVPRQVFCAFVAGATGPAFGGGSAPLVRVTQPLRLPPIKSRHLAAYRQRALAGLLKRPAAYDRETAATRQATIWAGIQPDLSRLPQVPSYGDGATLALPVAGGTRTIQLPADSPAVLQEQLRRPRWNALGTIVPGGEPAYDIDHMIEYQLGGVDELQNLELLDAGHNRSVGGQFRGAIDMALRADILAAPAGDAQYAPYRSGGAVSAAQLSAFKAAVCAEFRVVEGQGEREARSAERREGSSFFLSAEEVRTLAHVRDLLPPRAPGDGSDSEFVLLSPSGALELGRIAHRQGVVRPAALRSLRGLGGFTPTAMVLEPRPGFNDATPVRPRIGTLTGQLDLGPQVIVGGTAGVARTGASAGRNLQSVSLDIVRSGNWQGRLADPAVPAWPATFTPLSPMQIEGLSIGDGVYARASIQPSHPALSGLQLPAQIINGRLMLAYTVDATALARNLNVPGLSINSAALVLGYDGQAFSVGGSVLFEIRNFGQGELRAELDSAGRFQLEGSFTADTRLFDRAELRLWYRSEGGFGGEGLLAITDPNKIRGIRAARVQARYQQGVFSASGSVEPNIPGLRSAGLSVRYGPDETGADSLLIAGDLQLATGVPGVRGGSVHVDVLQRDEQWQVSASGELQPAIPGVNATLRASYARGAFSASVDTPFRVGERVSGQLLVGVSNLPCNADGSPQEGATPGERLFAFGQGRATVRLSDSWSASFGIAVAGDASVRINGSVDLAQPITLFEQRPWSRPLLSIPAVSIPLLGVAVGDSVAGIALVIRGDVRATASLGPGQIDRGTVSVRDFNPAQPDSLHLGGELHFNLPARAGIEAGLEASVDAGAVLLRASAGLRFALGLGVDASVANTLTLDWRPAQGLVLSSQLQAQASPRLQASVSGFAQVVANAFVTTFTLWRKDYQIAERAFGSGLAIGMTVPVTWRERGGLDFNFSQVQFQVPEISPRGALADLLRDEGAVTERNDVPPTADGPMSQDAPPVSRPPDPASLVCE